MIPGIPQAAMAIAAACFTMLAAWYLNKKLMPWLQKFQTTKDTASDINARATSSAQNQIDNQESDKLREIDGR